MNGRINNHNKKQEILDRLNADIKVVQNEISLIDKCPKTLTGQLFKHFNNKYNLRVQNIEETVIELENIVKTLEDTKSKLDNFGYLAQIMQGRKNGGISQ